MVGALTSLEFLRAHWRSVLTLRAVRLRAIRTALLTETNQHHQRSKPDGDRDDLHYDLCWYVSYLGMLDLLEKYRAMQSC